MRKQTTVAGWRNDSAPDMTGAAASGAGGRLAALGLTAVFAGTLAYSSLAAAPDKKVKASSGPAPSMSVAGLPGPEVAELSARFEKDLWPRMQAACLPCHGQKNASQFLLPGDSRTAFLKMLGEGQFDPDNHSSASARVATTDPELVMPPPSMGITLKPEEVALFTKFSEEVQKRRAAHGGKPDEEFPAHLMPAYNGARRQLAPDTTFLSYTQLKGKVRAIFADDWKRGERDRFVENVHLFGGADFVNRFDESTKASPTFLTALDLLGRDVASKAYLGRTGPFAGFPQQMPSPVSMKAPAGPIAQGIDTLYRRMLFRTPTNGERAQALALLQSVYKAQGKLAETAARQNLQFRLTVKDDAGMVTAQDVTVPVTADTAHGLYSEFVDQSKDAATDKEKTATRTLTRQFTFAPGDKAQKVHITNAGTHGNVSVASIAVRGPLPATTEKVITVEDASLAAEGAWRIKKDDGLVSYEDNNENKGDSHLTFPVSVAQPGKYEVAVAWRRFAAPNPGKGKDGKPRRQRGPVNGAENVLVEVVSRDKESRPAVPAAPAVPPKGEAHFFIDQSVDTVAYWDLKTAFRFGDGPTEGVELRNAGTRKRVVADAVRLAPTAAPADATPLVLKAAEAGGKDKWVQFAKGTFRAYNTVGPDIFQDQGDEGKRENLSLLYRPAAAKKEGYDPAKFYQVGVIYPGQADNETRVPLVVRAKASSPIVRVVHPLHAHTGAPVTLDASASYNLQGSKLTFRWEQTGGPRVSLADPKAAKLSFVAPQLSAEQAAWEGLCRALLAHPDFLFTRPRSLATIEDAKVKRRLQLVKLAQDLLARTPTPAELAEVDAGKPISALVDRYLASKEFRDFYFHRVRLYLESHGTPEQDEPARLWTYVALQDRPFKEILTADYTVNTDWQKKARPAYHGKTGVLTMKGFLQGKPGLPHFNYPAQVTEKFLGYVFEVPDSILNTRNGITAAATTDPNSVCYTCHKVLTPLAYQRGHWDDEGNYRQHDDTGLRIDASDQAMVASYPYKGDGIEAFALQAQNKERFLRTILQTHFVWYFGREMRYEADERALYRRLWDVTSKNRYALRPLIRAMVLSPEYLNGPSQTPAPAPKAKPNPRLARAKLAVWHKTTMAPKKQTRTTDAAGRATR